MWSNGREMLGARGRHADPRGEQVGALPLAARARSSSSDPGFRGLMTFTLPESLWLHGHGFDDLLLAYPTADRGSARRARPARAERAPILMVDSVEHLDYIEAAAGAGGRPIRVCIELDVGWWPLRRAREGRRQALADAHARAGAGAGARDRRPAPASSSPALMGYEAHIAGVGDRPLGKRMQGRVIRADEAPLGGARSPSAAPPWWRPSREVAPVADRERRRHRQRPHTRSEPVVTEITAGSGFFASTLFDRYADFTLTPAAMFAMPVVRRPSGGVATLLGGGYHASGAPGPDRLPGPYLPRGLRLDPHGGRRRGADAGDRRRGR